MALCSLRLRRNLATLSTLRRSLSSSLMISAQPTAPSSFFSPTPSSSVSCESSTAFVLFRQFRAFRSSRTLLLSSRSSRYSDLNAEEIGPDTILFEGCDYKHWLIVMDFGKDNESKPTSEEMVRIYEETCAKGLNISVEEAKKRMYACSTTTYTGFQVEMTEEESEKFNGLDRVIFVLPDSYIDPVNKEYGGDKYINGTIIPRPPPIQYGRMGPRNRDRNRNPEQSRYRGNPSYNYQQGSGSNFGPSQNHPQQQNYNPASQNSQPLSNSAPGSQFDNPQQNYRSGLNYQPQQNYSPPSQRYQPQQNYGPPSQSYQPQQNYGPPSQSYQPQQNYGPPSQSYQPQQNYSPPSQTYQPQQNYSPPSQSYQPQQNYAKPPPNYQPQQKYGQNSQSYVPQQNNANARNDVGDYPSQGATGTYRPGTQAGGAQDHSWNGEAQRFPQGQQRSMQGDQTNYSPAGQTENDPVRY